MVISNLTPRGIKVKRQQVLPFHLTTNVLALAKESTDVLRTPNSPRGRAERKRHKARSVPPGKEKFVKNSLVMSQQRSY